MIFMPTANEESETNQTSSIPAEVAMVMSAIEAGAHIQNEQREVRRAKYRTATNLRLFRDDAMAPAWRLYTRDINRRGLGFITPHRLPLGYGGIVLLRDGNGKMERVHCTLSRCREATPGWYEGSLHFNREQPHFDELCVGENSNDEIWNDE
jgi:hypothetical protein